jgi:RecB family endonuclease NucS
MSKSIIECLFYNFYNSYLLGNSENAEMYYEFLKNEYKNDSSCFDFLQEDERWDILRKLIETVKNKLVVKNFNYEKRKTEEEIIRDKEIFKYEKELVLQICKNKEKLKDVLKIENLEIYNLEHITNYGFVDIVCQDKMTMYVIEVKKSVAKYDVVSQIDKYVLDFKLKLNLKHWNKVVGVVIANGFQNYAINELLKNGIIVLKYSIINDNLNFSRVG